MTDFGICIKVSCALNSLVRFVQKMFRLVTRLTDAANCGYSSDLLRKSIASNVICSRLFGSVDIFHLHLIGGVVFG